MIENGDDSRGDVSVLVHQIGGKAQPPSQRSNSNSEGDSSIIETQSDDYVLTTRLSHGITTKAETHNKNTNQQ